MTRVRAQRHWQESAVHFPTGWGFELMHQPDSTRVALDDRLVNAGYKRVLERRPAAPAPIANSDPYDASARGEWMIDR